MLSRDTLGDDEPNFEQAPTLQAILLAIDSLKCQLRAANGSGYDPKRYPLKHSCTMIWLNMNKVPGYTWKIPGCIFDLRSNTSSLNYTKG